MYGSLATPFVNEIENEVVSKFFFIYVKAGISSYVAPMVHKLYDKHKDRVYKIT